MIPQLPNLFQFTQPPNAQLNSSIVKYVTYILSTLQIPLLHFGCKCIFRFVEKSIFPVCFILIFNWLDKWINEVKWVWTGGKVLGLICWGISLESGIRALFLSARCLWVLLGLFYSVTVFLEKRDIVWTLRIPFYGRKFDARPCIFYVLMPLIWAMLALLCCYLDSNATIDSFLEIIFNIYYHF